MRICHWLSIVVVLLVCVVLAPAARGCTGITLKAKNGDICYGRTLEWGSFDLKSRLIFYPRNYRYSAELSGKRAGMSWRGKYGVAGIDLLEKGYIADGMNEAGVVAGLFYMPGFAEYATLVPQDAERAMAPTDVMQYLLSTCRDLDEVKRALAEIQVVQVVEDALGFPAPIHLLVTESSGRQVVVEWRNGRPVISEAPLGVITNAPWYGWHMINLRNYVKLTPTPAPGFDMNGVEFTPLGGGSGMLGLPGDFTPPSRFVRAVEFCRSARSTPNGNETIYEIFRILDNFNVPLGSAEGGGKLSSEGMRSATIWTSAWNLRGKTLYYHTQHNRMVRRVRLDKVDFGMLDRPLALPLDEVKEQSIQDRTPIVSPNHGNGLEKSEK